MSTFGMWSLLEIVCIEKAKRELERQGMFWKPVKGTKEMFWKMFPLIYIDKM